MSPVQADQVYKSKAQILQEILDDWRAAIPDIAISPDTLVRLWSEVFAHTTEGLFLALQELYSDAFVQTAGPIALQRYGQMYGRPQKQGTLAQGEVRFSGAGGEFIAIGSQVGAPRPLLADTLVFETLDDVVIPDPGEPDAPTIADGGAGNISGTLEYAVTFVTLGGETAIGDASNTVTVVTEDIDLTAIPLGGDGTTARKIYRRNGGGAWAYVATIANNSDTTYTDNLADGGLGGPPPSESTAERVTVAAQALATGIAYNVAVGAITEIVAVDADVNAVTNLAEFTEGTDPETIEEFRQELIEWIQAPQSGSVLDLIAWATSIDGVETASVSENVDTGGGAYPGMNVIRIAGPDGAVPDADLIAEVQDYIDSKDIAGIINVVATFTPLTVPVEVTLTLDAGYSTADVEDQVTQAIIDYVDAVPVGGIVYVAGIYHAVFSLPGVSTLTVDDPTSDVTADPDEKPVTTTADITVN